MYMMYVLFISEFEASFIRLVDKVTNGSKVVISETGMLNVCKYMLRCLFLIMF